MKTYKQAQILVILVLAQCFGLLLLINNTLVAKMDKSIATHRYNYPVMTITCILGICTIFLFAYMFKLLKIEKENIIKLNNSQEVVDALHGQRHDFNNHLNAICGMLQLGESEEALEYIWEVNGRVSKVFNISKIKSIEVAATLCRKCAIAESKSIKVTIDISSDLEYLKIDSVDVCKILFNILNNAIHELGNCDIEERELTIIIDEDVNNYIISITNSYPILSEDQINQLFIKGYSTKEGEGHGYGLPITKQIIEKYDGRIEVNSYKGIGTTFTIVLPKRHS